MFAKGLYNLIKIAQVVMNIHHGAPRPHKNGWTWPIEFVLIIWSHFILIHWKYAIQVWQKGSFKIN